MESLNDIEGTFIVSRGFSLIDHMRALRVNQYCYVYLRDFNPTVIRSTACKLKKEGYHFSVKGVSRGNLPVERMKETRIKSKPQS